MLTGEGSTEVAVEAMKQGAEDYLVKDTGGQYLRLLPSVVARVMTAKIQREQTRCLQQQTESLLRRNLALMQNSMDGIHIMDIQGNLLECNEAFCSMLGYTLEEIAGLNATDWNAQRSPEDLHHWFENLIGNSTLLQTVYRRKDGTLIHVEISSTGIDMDGQGIIFSSGRDITSRNKAEEMLQKSRANQRAMLDNSPYQAWLKDADGRYTALNRVFANQLQMKDSNQIIGKTDFDLLPRELAEKYCQDDARVLSNLPPLHVEEPALIAGQMQWVETWKTPIIDDNGNILGTAGFARDITQRKQAETVLLQHKLVIDTSIDGFWMADMQGNLLEANEAYARLSGYTVAELVNMNISQLEALERTPDEVRAHIAKIVAQGYDRFETRHRHKDGHEIDIDISVTYRVELQRMCVFCRDISERKQIGLKLQRNQDLLKQAQRLGKMGSWELDLLSGVLLWSDEMYRIFELDPDEFTPSYERFLSVIHPDDRDKVNQAYTQSLLDRQPYDVVHRLQFTDGRIKWIREHCTSVFDPSGKPLRSTGMTQDISEQKLTEDTLQKNEANLRAMLDNSPFLTWLKDEDGRYITINKVFADYLKLETIQQAIGKTDLELQPNELAKKYRADDAEVMAARRHKHVEESSYDGNNLHWVETWKTPIIDTHGNVLGTVGFASDISERKHMQLKTESLLRRNLALMKTSMDGIHVLDMQGNVVEANDSFCHMLGYSREEIETLNVADWVANFSSDELRARFEDHLGKSLMIETIHRRKDGTLIDVEISITGEILDGQGLLFCSSRDITERKKAERKLLQESEIGHKRAEVLAQQFGHLLRNSFNEIYLFDAESLNFLLTSEGAEKNLGYSDEELGQFTPMDLSPWQNRQSFESLVAPLRSGQQQSLLFNTSFCRKNGTRYPVEVRLQLMQAESPMFLAVAQDITERKAKDEILRFHSNILTSMTEGIHLTRVSDERIVFANSQLEKMFGYESGELVGMHVSVLNADGEHGPLATAEAINSELEKRGTWSGEVYNIKKDGTHFWCHANVTTFEHSKFGKVWVSVHADISKRKHSEQQARELSAHLHTVREEEKANYARDIHDDLGGTLAALKMDAHWLAGRLAAKAEMEPLRECAKSMVGLLDNAVLATRRIITELRPTLLDDLGLLEALKWQAAEFNLRTGIECRVINHGNGRPGNELGDLLPINLFRIFQEALTNISRHSGASRVEVNLHLDEEEVILSICDDGCGLPEGHSIASTSYGIRGMCERVSLLCGNIEFDHPPGKGFCVTVILPVPAAQDLA